jgi:hypothetical protein
MEMVELNSQLTNLQKEEKSQIENTIFLWWTRNTAYCIATDDIIKTVSQLKARGVEFCLLHLIRIIRQFQNDWRPYENDEEDLNEIEKLLW